MGLEDVMRAELEHVCPSCNEEGEPATDDNGNELYYSRCTNKDGCDVITFRRVFYYTDVN